MMKIILGWLFVVAQVLFGAYLMYISGEFVDTFMRIFCFLNGVLVILGAIWQSAKMTKDVWWF